MMSESEPVGILPSHKLVRSKYCCLIINKMKKDLYQLRIENERIQLLEEEYKGKLCAYQEMSLAIDNKLYHLRSLGNEISSVHHPEGHAVDNFVTRVEEKREFGDVSIRRHVQTVQLTSHTTPNVPLTRILDSIRSLAIQAKETLDKIRSHVQCMNQYHELRREITLLTDNLQNGDFIIREILFVSEATQYLTELEKVTDSFQENVTVDALEQHKLPEKILLLQEGNQTYKCNDLTAFTSDVQLLTGELLGHEHYLDHHSKIEPIVRHEIPEIPNVSPFSCNQTELNNTQNTTGEQNILWNFVCMVPGADSTLAETMNKIQKMRQEILTLNETATGLQQCENHECAVTSGSLSQNYLKGDDNTVQCGRFEHYPPRHIDQTEAITNNGTAEKFPET